MALSVELPEAGGVFRDDNPMTMIGDQAMRPNAHNSVDLSHACARNVVRVIGLVEKYPLATITALGSVVWISGPNEPGSGDSRPRKRRSSRADVI